MYYLDDETGVIHYDQDLERERRERKLVRDIDARITWQPSR